jgi:hypothetical protein
MRTRFAPAPTGYLHLGHVANVVHVWGMARVAGAIVLLRIEDHDRSRVRPAYDAALLEDLAWLGFSADEGPVRQSDDAGPYAAALERLLADDLVYGCDCSRETFATWSREHGREWHGPGCPGGCRARHVPGPVLRVALGGGSERWMDGLVGPCSDDVAVGGDAPDRDATGDGRTGSRSWSTIRQDGAGPRHPRPGSPARHRRPGRLGGSAQREKPATFAHHALIAGGWTKAVEGRWRHLGQGASRSRTDRRGADREAAAASGWSARP